jgi:hypothetical protein
MSPKAAFLSKTLETNPFVRKEGNFSETDVHISTKTVKEECRCFIQVLGKVK